MRRSGHGKPASLDGGVRAVQTDRHAVRRGHAYRTTIDGRGRAQGGHVYAVSAIAGTRELRVGNVVGGAHDGRRRCSHVNGGILDGNASCTLVIGDVDAGRMRRGKRDGAGSNICLIDGEAAGIDIDRAVVHIDRAHVQTRCTAVLDAWTDSHVGVDQLERPRRFHAHAVIGLRADALDGALRGGRAAVDLQTCTVGGSNGIAGRCLGLKHDLVPVELQRRMHALARKAQIAGRGDIQVGGEEIRAAFLNGQAALRIGPKLVQVRGSLGKIAYPLRQLQGRALDRIEQEQVRLMLLRVRRRTDNGFRRSTRGNGLRSDRRRLQGRLSRG